MAGRVLWCLGMYASASTWLFNVVRQIQTVSDTRSLQTYFISGAEIFEEFAPHTVNLVKSHEISDEQMIVKLAGQADKILISLRDPRDAVTSLMRSHHQDFQQALKFVEESMHLCRGFAKDKRALVFNYKSGFFENLATVHRIAAHLGFQLSASAAQNIFDTLTRAAVEKHIAGMAAQKDILQDTISGDLLDPQTQWHSHHAGRSGESGRWREELSATQISEIERRIAC